MDKKPLYAFSASVALGVSTLAMADSNNPFVAKKLSDAYAMGHESMQNIDVNEPDGQQKMLENVDNDDKGLGKAKDGQCGNESDGDKPSQQTDKSPQGKCGAGTCG